MNWKVTDSDFVYLEDEVRFYPRYKAKIEHLIYGYLYATPERDENGGGKSNLPSRPTEAIAMNIVNDLVLMRMRKHVEDIEHAYNELDEEKQRFIHALYWRPGSKKIDSLAICAEFNIKRSTYLRWKKAFLHRVGILTGIKRI